jgi:asparagine synthase (glutamine-hydrolysing)
MWAFVIYDKLERTLFMSRDRMGEKPLYYIHQGKHFAFASEMKSLYNKLNTIQYDRDFISFYVANPYDNEWMTETLIKGIKKFPAGHYATLRDGKLEIKQYYNPASLLKQPNHYGHIQEAVDEFKSLFSSSCSMRACAAT